MRWPGVRGQRPLGRAYLLLLPPLAGVLVLSMLKPCSALYHTPLLASLHPPAAFLPRTCLQTGAPNKKETGFPAKWQTLIDGVPCFAAAGSWQ